ncbi:MAG: HAMP domain-containing sensor histidine kinase [Kiloniellales bacterium]|jgi:signal transduction histidine kinase|nr:HAMP domain-containing sensor histidine kinase [Kiloniellales bacterium]
MLELRGRRDRRGTLLERYGKQFGYVMERHKVEAALTVAKQNAERAAEAARVAMIKAQTSDRTKSEFLANMSHELRTPLNAILGFSEIMKNEILGPLGAEQYKEYIRDIHESGTYLLDVINDILDISKVETGNLELAESEVDVGEVVAKSIRLVQERARDSGVKLIVTIDDDVPGIFADERMVKQCLVNLLSNAVKFTPQDGKVETVARSLVDGGLCVSVADTGIGICEEDFDRVLSPFGQVESAYSGTYEGTGLGLPITKALIELHGGHLALQSAVGVGTTVTLSFPKERILEPVA